jgi:cephalosporin hydroxylase
MIKIDLEQGTVTVEEPAGTREYKLDTPEAFQIVSDAWLRAGWDNKYVYSFTWLGRPIIQLPEDMIRLQEVIHAVQPDVIVETGVAHGGSLVFYASLCKATDRGRVIGVDVEIRPHNREAIESHRLSSLITTVEGSSIEPAVVNEVKSQIGPGETVMVMLDASHQKQHVLAELEAY